MKYNIKLLWVYSVRKHYFYASAVFKYAVMGEMVARFNFDAS